MRILLLVLFMFSAPLAHAQRAGESLWLDADYAYTQFSYKESKSTQKGNLAGIRANLGLGLFDNFGITAGGEYRDGNLNYNGATYIAGSHNGMTGDYMRETYLLANLMFGPITVSAGLAQSEWYNNISGIYRRRLFADYYPISVTIHRSAFYIKAETYMRKSGHSQIQMRDVSTGENDVDLKQNSGTGYGAEIGLRYPAMFHTNTRIFIAYKKWDIAASETQNDGVRDIQVDKYSLEILQAGLGISF